MSDNYLQFAIPEGTSLSDLRSKLPMDIEFSEEPSKNTGAYVLRQLRLATL